MEAAYDIDTALSRNTSASTSLPWSFKMFARLFMAWSYSGFNLRKMSTELLEGGLTHTQTAKNASKNIKTEKKRSETV